MNRSSEYSQSLNGSVTEEALSLSIEKIFSNENKDLSADVVKKFLDQALAKIKENNSDPNRLVRVVSKGKVLWMTIDQANDYLINNEDPDLNHDIEEALKGDIKVIKNEIKFLLALAQYTLEQYRDQEDISSKEFNQLEPKLKKHEKEVNDHIDESIEKELILKEKRKGRPLLNQYEQLMEKFIQIKDDPNYQDLATALAEQLEKHKLNYLRYARAIEPDLQRVYEGRMNLQLSKKNILQTHNNINTLKQETLRLEINELKEKLILMDKNISDSENMIEESVQENKDEDQLNEYHKTKQHLMNKQDESNALEKSNEIIRQQQHNISAVVKKINQDLLDTESLTSQKSTPSATYNDEPVKRNVKESEFETTKKGMYTRKR